MRLVRFGWKCVFSRSEVRLSTVRIDSTARVSLTYALSELMDASTFEHIESRLVFIQNNPGMIMNGTRLQYAVQ